MKTTPTIGTPAWLSDGEKYALVGLSLKVDGNITTGKIAPSLWLLEDAGFAMPTHWLEWLGSIRAGEVQDCNIFLISKVASLSPTVLDAESQRLMQQVSNFYAGLMLACRFSPAHRPIMLTGARTDGEYDVRQQQDFKYPVPCVFRFYPAVRPEDFELAARLGENIGIISSALIAGGHWRLFRALHIYIEARTAGDILERLHQYCRCIDGLILPAAGNTRSQFKSRTELFIGPRHHKMMGEIYDVRSAVEHLHENRYLEGFDRETRLDLVKKEAIAEHIARTALCRIIGTPGLWPHFANTTALAAFWSMAPNDRRRIWGDPIDPMDALKEFDEQFINDGQLGAI